jgi:hypothetical protein
VQGGAQDVLASLQRVLNEFDQFSDAVEPEDNADEEAPDHDDDPDDDDPDDDDPAPGLFTDDVSCLMLLLPSLIMCILSWYD